MTDLVVTEITTALGGVQIETPAVDYSSFQTSDSTINIDQFGHVIELYDFPQEMKTNDLMSAFSAFTSRYVLSLRQIRASPVLNYSSSNVQC